MNIYESGSIYRAMLSTTFSFVVLLILTRILGKKQMSQLTFFNYITGITIGSIAANAITLVGKELVSTLFGLFWWCLLTFTIDIFVVKFPKYRVILDDQPSILIKNGEIQYKEFKKIRLDFDNFFSLMREENVFSITEIDYAILEPNGELTILKKAEYEKVTRKDLNITPVPNYYLPTQIIINGKVIKKNMKEFNLTIDWLYKQLNSQGVSEVKNVLYAELQHNGELYIDQFKQ